MAQSLTATVVVPTYNRAQLLGYTLAALTRQDLSADRFEVVVVDDGSSDDTAAVVEAYRDRLDLSYHFQPDDGYRVAAARNVGINAARNDVCVLLDSGVLPHSGCLRAHLDSHAADGPPQAVIGYVYGFNLDNEDAEAIRGLVDPTDADAAIKALAADGRWPDMREDFYRSHDDDIATLRAPWTVFWTCNVSVRTATLREVGAFDETFRSWGGEDVDLGIRLHLAGARFVVDRAAASLHYPHDKLFADNLTTLVPNYCYIAAKYDTPTVRLLPAIPTINPFNLDQVADHLDLPRCADVLGANP
ncbi:MULTISPECIES: glycosyltransferase [Micromonospora]|uniref:N-terminal domain of galactosyltransferase n=1 Tax=Micromonospora yangpuensis TaxID=683228 RepID=A0A1C6TXA4_9ACTN|nr:glycosyltransferase [Micromonospora yangpuensis]GGM01882.1 glycosyl transferase [Micromonospora yangpuensis]SCL46387.1 N-terminal domain of galactosyltransferase [Micromonospora yangpuensis]